MVGRLLVSLSQGAARKPPPVRRRQRICGKRRIAGPERARGTRLMSTSAGHTDAGYDRPYRDMATFARVTPWLLYASAAVSAAGFYFSGLGGDGSTPVASAPPAPLQAVVGLLEFPLWIAHVVTVLRWQLGSE